MLVTDGNDEMTEECVWKSGYILSPALAERALAEKAIGDIAAKLARKL